MQTAPVLAGDVPIAAIQQGRDRQRATMAKASTAGAASQRERQRERQRAKRETERDRATSAREQPAMTPKPPPPRASGSQTERQRGASPKTRRESALAQVCSLSLLPPPSRSLCFLPCVCVACVQSLEEWLTSLGNSCERYLEQLQQMGFKTVYTLVEENPRPEVLKQGGITQPSCRRRIWQATQRLQTHSNYKRALRETMEPQLVKARALARTQVKPRTPRVSVNALHPVPLPTDQQPVRKASKLISVANASTAPSGVTLVDELIKLPELPKSARRAQASSEGDWSPRRRPIRQRDRDRASKAERVARRAQEIAESEVVSNQWIRGSRHTLGLHNPVDVERQQAELQYVDQQLALRKTERQEEEARRERYWKEKIEPINKKRQEQLAAGRWDTLLKRARNEQQQMRKERERARREREDRARDLLKDMSYVLEQTGGDGASRDELKRRHEHQAFIDHMTNETRARRIDQPTLQEVRQLHELMLKQLFNKFDKDGGGSLDREEICALARGIGHKLTPKELDAAMLEMDQDGEGDVDFVEFYTWWQKNKEKSDGPLKIDTSGGGEPFTITIVRI